MHRLRFRIAVFGRDFDVSLDRLLIGHVGDQSPDPCPGRREAEFQLAGHFVDFFLASSQFSDLSDQKLFDFRQEFLRQVFQDLVSEFLREHRLHFGEGFQKRGIERASFRLDDRRLFRRFGFFFDGQVLVLTRELRGSIDDFCTGDLLADQFADDVRLGRSILRPLFVIESVELNKCFLDIHHIYLLNLGWEECPRGHPS